MIINILSIEIPTNLECNNNEVTIVEKQIKNSKFQINLVNNKPQIKYQFNIALSPSQKTDVDCLMKLTTPVDCDVALSEAPKKIKAQLSFDGKSYILTAFI